MMFPTVMFSSFSKDQSKRNSNTDGNATKFLFTKNEVTKSKKLARCSISSQNKKKYIPFYKSLNTFKVKAKCYM